MSRNVTLVPLIGTGCEEKPTIGVEIESEGATSWNDVVEAIPSACGYGGDGSLSDGLEIQTPPANGDQFEAIITDTCNVLKTSGASISSRCGLHVHVSFPIDKRKIKRFFLLAAAFEDIFYASQPASRFTGRYCRSISLQWRNLFSRLEKLPSEDIDLFLYSKSNKEDVKRIKRDHWIDQRYFGFNIHSVFSRNKTIEFRFAAGSIDAKEIIAWANFCASFAEYAASSKYSKSIVLKGIEATNPREKLIILSKTGFFSEDSLTFVSQRMKKFERTYLTEKRKSITTKENSILAKYKRLEPFYYKLDDLNTMEERTAEIVSLVLETPEEELMQLYKDCSLIELIHRFSHVLIAGSPSVRENKAIRILHSLRSRALTGPQYGVFEYPF